MTRADLALTALYQSNRSAIAWWGAMPELSCEDGMWFATLDALVTDPETGRLVDFGYDLEPQPTPESAIEALIDAVDRFAADCPTALWGARGYYPEWPSRFSLSAFRLALAQNETMEKAA